MAEINPQQAEHTIPTREILAWYEAERVGILNEMEKMEFMRQTALLDGKDISRDLETKQLINSGRIATLGSFATFLTSRSSNDKSVK